MSNGIWTSAHKGVCLFGAELQKRMASPKPPDGRAGHIATGRIAACTQHNLHTLDFLSINHLRIWSRVLSLNSRAGNEKALATVTAIIDGMGRCTSYTCHIHALMSLADCTAAFHAAEASLHVCTLHMIRSCLLYLWCAELKS